MTVEDSASTSGLYSVQLEIVKGLNQSRDKIVEMIKSEDDSELKIQLLEQLKDINKTLSDHLDADVNILVQSRLGNITAELKKIKKHLKITEKEKEKDE